MALKHGAAHVTALDINKDMADISRQTLSDYEPDRSKWKVQCGKICKEGKTRTSFTPKEPFFDMLVSEILGTLTTSESMYEHTADALPYLNRFDGKLYVIPQKTTQYVTLYDFHGMFDACSIPQVISNGLRASLPCPNPDVVQLTPSNDSGIGLPLYGIKHTQVSKKTPINTETYLLDDEGTKWQRDRPKGWEDLDLLVELPTSGMKLGETHFVVFEWEVELFDGVMLRNTLEAMKPGNEYGISEVNAAARHSQWGWPDYHRFRSFYLPCLCRFMLCRAVHPDKPAQAYGVQCTVCKWEKGIPEFKALLYFYETDV